MSSSGKMDKSLHWQVDLQKKSVKLKMTPPGQYQPRYRALLLTLLLAFLAYAGLFHIEDVLSQRNYSAIPGVEVRIAYCMLTNLSPYEKYVLAQSVSLSSDPTFYSAVLTEALSGEVTDLKRAAIGALKERDEIQRRAMQLVLRVADKCEYEKIPWRAEVSALKILERWIQYDPGYLFFVAKAKRAPDAAEQLYRLRRKAG